MTGNAAAFMTMPMAKALAHSTFARVEVHRDPAPILSDWADLEALAPCSIYQTRAWLLPWVEALAGKTGITPLFIVARDADDRPLALLGLGIVRRGPLRIASWLGGSDSNFNMPLARPDIAWTQADVLRLLREAAKACGRDKPDLFNLVNQPLEWNGRPNPMALLPQRPSPSAAFGTVLPADAETLFAAKLSKDTRKKLRKKEAKLAALGPLTHLIVTDTEQQRRVIRTFLAQKLARFRTQKIVSEFASPEMRDFIEAASPPCGQGIELHALLAGDRIVATYGGAAHAGRWSGMFNSFDGDDEISKSSPGDLLLMRILTKACADGLIYFDLGIGEARYKAALCDKRLALFDAVVAISLFGVAVAHLVAARQALKRWIKSKPRLFAIIRTITSFGRLS